MERNIEIYFDKEENQIWVLGSDWSNPERADIYNLQGEWVDYDDFGEDCIDWCKKLHCKTLGDAIEMITRSRNKKARCYC
jgi:hypothetical protein